MGLPKTTNSGVAQLGLAMLLACSVASCTHPVEEISCRATRTGMCLVRMEVLATKLRDLREHPSLRANVLAGEGGEFLILLTDGGKSVLILEQCGHPAGNFVCLDRGGSVELAVLPRDETPAFWQRATNGLIRVEQEWKDSFVRWLNQQ